MPELAWVVIITVSKRDPIIPQIKLHLLQADTRTKTRVKYSENKTRPQSLVNRTAALYSYQLVYELNYSRNNVLIQYATLVDCSNPQTGSRRP